MKKESLFTVLYDDLEVVEFNWRKDLMDDEDIVSKTCNYNGAEEEEYSHGI